MIKIKLFSTLLFFTLLVACSDYKSTRYQDISALEMPPEMEVIKKPEVLIAEKVKTKKTGLGDSVSIVEEGKQSIVKIKKTFERSWEVVEKSLKLSGIQITDKNRDKGVFYVLFDPDENSERESGFLNNITFFMFEDEYAEAAYQLTVAWQESDTEVRVDLVKKDKVDELSDDDFDFEDTVDSGRKLLNALYKTIKDDLPLD